MSIREQQDRLMEKIRHLMYVKEDSLPSRVLVIRDELESLAAGTRSQKLLDDLQRSLEELIARLDSRLTPSEIVRLTRSPERFTLEDVVHHIYSNAEEIGSRHNLTNDGAIVVYKAEIDRRRTNGQVTTEPVLVIGHEKGRDEHFRNGGAANPFGNQRARQYMEAAQLGRGVPVHLFVTTPGAIPDEEPLSAWREIAQNLYVMAGLSVPTVAVNIGEGGSGGAEALFMVDFRAMTSKAWHTVISPEGAGAIRNRFKLPVPQKVIDEFAEQVKLTAKDNLRHGIVDRIIPEPPFGATRSDFEFFDELRYEMIRMTDQVVLSTRRFRSAGSYLKRQGDYRTSGGEFSEHVPWQLSSGERRALVRRRQERYIEMASEFLHEGSLGFRAGEFLVHMLRKSLRSAGRKTIYFTSAREQITQLTDEVATRVPQTGRLSDIVQRLFPGKTARQRPVRVEPEFSRLYEFDDIRYLKLDDAAEVCITEPEQHCPDIWKPDLFGELKGVCPNCDYHFPMNYQWCLELFFDPGSVRQFNSHIAAINPLRFRGVDERLQRYRESTGRRSAADTFEAKVNGRELTVFALNGHFWGGSVGAAEIEKFVRAIRRAGELGLPFLAYVHNTVGIRIEEGSVGLAAMPKGVAAVRKFIDNGGKYTVLYDHSSFAGPVASFLGCSPDQYGIMSSNLGFAGPKVIEFTTGEQVPPDYHSILNALGRGHIQNVWDRREAKDRLYRALDGR